MVSLRWGQLSARAPGRSNGRPAAGGCGRGLTLRGQRVETPAWPVFERGDLRIFPPASQETHLLEPSQRSIQRAVGRQQASIGERAEVFCDFVAVKLTNVAVVQIGGGFADGLLEGHQLAGFAAHSVTISIYLLIVKSPPEPAGSVSHRIDNGVDAERVALGGKLQEVAVVVALALEGVAEVGVVGHQHHDAAAVLVHDGAHVRYGAVAAAF